MTLATNSDFVISVKYDYKRINVIIIVISIIIIIKMYYWLNTPVMLEAQELREISIIQR